MGADSQRCVSLQGAVMTALRTVRIWRNGELPRHGRGPATVRHWRRVLGPRFRRGMFVAGRATRFPGTQPDLSARIGSTSRANAGPDAIRLRYENRLKRSCFGGTSRPTVVSPKGRITHVCLGHRCSGIHQFAPVRPIPDCGAHPLLPCCRGRRLRYRRGRLHSACAARAMESRRRNLRHCSARGSSD